MSFVQCSSARCRFQVDTDLVGVSEKAGRYYVDCPVCDTRTEVFRFERDGEVRYWTQQH